MSQGQPDVTPQDAIKVAQNALRKVNELEATVESQGVHIQQLEQRVEQLEEAMPDATEYDNLDRDDKGALVREHLIRLAQDTNGKAKATYQDIKHSVFNGQPSDGHCFDLMEEAARKAGFDVVNPSDAMKHVRVDLDETARENTSTTRSRVNNETP